jgi:hypothetical protein
MHYASFSHLDHFFIAEWGTAVNFFSFRNI